MFFSIRVTRNQISQGFPQKVFSKSKRLDALENLDKLKLHIIVINSSCCGLQHLDDKVKSGETLQSPLGFIAKD